MNFHRFVFACFAAITLVKPVFSTENFGTETAHPRSVLGVEFEDQEMADKVIAHLLEAQTMEVNPIEFAFAKDDLELAEILLKMREQSLNNGRPTWDFPGYRFKRKWKHGQLIVWMRPAPVIYLNKWGGERFFYHNKLDVNAVKLLMKYDQENLWYYDLGEMGQHAYKSCDLEGLLFCLQKAYFELPKNPPTKFPNEDGAAKNKIGQMLVGTPAYLVDPFLSDFPIDLDNSKHFNNFARSIDLPSIWDYRPDDNDTVRDLKLQIQKIVWGSLTWEEGMIRPYVE